MVTRCKRRGKVLLLHTDRGAVVRSERVVFAQGYEIPRPLRRDLVRLHSTYAIISEPLDSFPGWEDRCLIWKTARPYRYVRSTSDGRVIFGGEDEPFRDAARRDRRLTAKAARLARGLARLLPSLEAEPAFGWTGTFGESPDGLPYIGELSGFPGGLFALGYGGNGITFGVVASDLIRDQCLGRPNPDLGIFRLER
jgi:glycine/D-amino acid oxidase-like deaminating enzyme